MNLAPEAAAAAAWLREKLGGRYRGVELLPSGEAQVTLVRRVPLVSYPGQWDEKIHFYFGRTPESALAEAKADVEKAILKAQAGASR